MVLQGHTHKHEQDVNPIHFHPDMYKEDEAEIDIPRPYDYSIELNDCLDDYELLEKSEMVDVKVDLNLATMPVARKMQSNNPRPCLSTVHQHHDTLQAESPEPGWP